MAVRYGCRSCLTCMGGLRGRVEHPTLPARRSTVHHTDGTCLVSQKSVCAERGGKKRGRGFGDGGKQSPFRVLVSSHTLGRAACGLGTDSSANKLHAHTEAAVTLIGSTSCSRARWLCCMRRSNSTFSRALKTSMDEPPSDCIFSPFHRHLPRSAFIVEII